MNLKYFLDNFDLSNPDWKTLPENFLTLDLAGLSSSDVGKYNAIKFIYEMENKKPEIKSETRNWNEPDGYKRMAVWQNASLLRLLIRKHTETLPKSEHRQKAQLDDAARSVKRNIEEGWKRPTTSEYLQFLGYSQGSLEEVKGDIYDAKTDGFLKSIPGATLDRLGFTISALKGKEIKGEPSEPEHPYFKALDNLRPEDLCYEIFLELINKTDWLLRKTVEALEKKLRDDKRYYEINQAKIRSNLRFR